MVRISLFLIVAVLLPQAAQAEGTPAATTRSFYHFAPPVPSFILQEQYIKQLTVIREDGLAQRAADGGTLSEDHRAVLQARIDKAAANYQKQLKRNDRFH